MHEIFPNKSRGSVLTASHVNTLSRVSRRSASAIPGSYTSSYGGIPVGEPPLVIESVEVTTVVDDEAQSYKVKHRYYDRAKIGGETPGEPFGWRVKQVGKNEYPMDSSEWGDCYEVGDVLQAYWHRQREAFIPLASRQRRIIFAITNEQITARSGLVLGTGSVSIYSRSGVNLTLEDDDVAALNWTTTAIAASTEVKIEKDACEYIITGQVC